MIAPSSRPAAPRRVALGLMLVVSALASGCAGFEGVDLGSVFPAGAAGPLDEATVASGLRQALDVGIQRTTASLSASGAFGANPALRLRLPGELGRFAQTLRGVGLGGQVDALEDAMNRAAETASGEVVPVFASAIGSMTIADAFAILNGENDAATRYFETRTAAELQRRIQPIAAGAMREVGLYTIYDDLRAAYDRIPLAKPASVDLEAHVAERTLAALFGRLAEEEGRIREDPGARTTALLRRVFGAARGGALGMGMR